jgi:hypothetical protein
VGCHSSRVRDQDIGYPFWWKSICGSWSQRLRAGFWGVRGFADQQRAGAEIVSLLHRGVLGGGTEIAHPALQRRTIIYRRATAKREARVANTIAGRGDPYRGLRGLGQKRLGLQRSRQRMPPMAGALDLEQGLRCPEIGFDAAQFILEDIGVAQRLGRALLLPTGIREFDQFT